MKTNRQPSPAPIPKGLHHSAQGCEERATQGLPGPRATTLKGLHPLFEQHIHAVAEKCDALLRSAPIHFPLGNASLPEKGAYLFSEGSQHLYAGRSDGIRDRLNTHQRESAAFNQAAFAALLARKECGIKADYRPAALGKHYSESPSFKLAFDKAKQSIRRMDIRVVEETNPVRQALLEFYIAVALPTHYNDFSNH